MNYSCIALLDNSWKQEESETFSQVHRRLRANVIDELLKLNFLILFGHFKLDINFFKLKYFLLIKNIEALNHPINNIVLQIQFQESLSNINFVAEDFFLHIKT